MQLSEHHWEKALQRKGSQQGWGVHGGHEESSRERKRASREVRGRRQTGRGPGEDRTRQWAVRRKAEAGDPITSWVWVFLTSSLRGNA